MYQSSQQGLCILFAHLVSVPLLSLGVKLNIFGGNTGGQSAVKSHLYLCHCPLTCPTWGNLLSQHTHNTHMYTHMHTHIEVDLDSVHEHSEHKGKLPVVLLVMIGGASVFSPHKWGQ